MPLTNLDEKQGCRIALWLVGGGVGLLWLLSPLPFGKTMGPHGRDFRAKSETKSLVLSIKGYQTEYARLPAVESPPATRDNSTGYDTTRKEGRGIIELLTGADASKNPRQILFYEPPVFKEGHGGYAKERGLVDLWGTKGYMIFLDYDGDGKIADPELLGATVNASAIVYSAGPDQDYSTWKDNVKSWDR